MRRTSDIACVLALVLAFIVGQKPEARAEGGVPVAIELVLAVDCSYSVNDHEYALQMQGIAAALRDPEVMALIENLTDGVALTLFHWASNTDNRLAVPWRLLFDRENILAFASEVERAPRRPLGYFTAVGRAIEFGVELIERNAYAGRQRKIDISGDGRSNAGPEPHVARLVAFARGITINGLAITGNDPWIADYYARHVVVGPASFVILAKTYDDFAIAIKRKLLRELGPQVAERW